MNPSDKASSARSSESAGYQHQARLLSIALSSIPDFAYVFDLNGRFLFVNQALLDLWGLKLADAVGKNFFELQYPPDMAEKLQRQIQEVIKTRQRLSDETPYTSPSGVPGYYEYVFTPVLAADGTVEAVAGCTRVITDRKQAADERDRLLVSERAARAEADAANRAKDKFLAVLSHELRTPLTPVAMVIPSMEFDPDLPLKFRDDLAMMRRNIDLEVKLIDDLLDLSRITTGKLRLHMQEVSVHDVLQHAIFNSSADAAGKRITIREELRAANDQLMADPARLQQVFWNLVRNAIKFTPEGGEITVRTWNDDPDKAFFAEVRDNGIGIPPDMLPRLFDAFEQGDARMTRQFGGLGLGLAIAKAVAEMHNGAITAASDGPGRGATFTVQLKPAAHPAHAPKQTTQGVAPAARLPEEPTRILLVEDHLDTARALARILKGSGYKVQIADSVQSALRLASTEEFDVLISDIGLPDASGYELMKQIRDLYGIQGIALSGYGMEDDIRKSRHAGFIDHVIKPINLDHLRAAIERATK